MIDHLVYGTPDLRTTVDELGTRLGLRPSPGGQHLGMGTRNHLADLGGRRYLEVVGPDPDQAAHTGPYFFAVDTLDRPRLVTWAIRVDDLAATRRRVLGAGYDLPEPRAMSRASADGPPITWQLTAPLADPDFGGLVPFVISWGDGSPHPSDRAVGGLMLESLTAVTPRPDELRRRLDLLGDTTPVEHGAVPMLRAVLRTPAGTVVLD